MPEYIAVLFRNAERALLLLSPLWFIVAALIALNKQQQRNKTIKQEGRNNFVCQYCALQSACTSRQEVMFGFDDAAKRQKSQEVNALPSDPFKYLSWHDIEEHDVQGNQLHCPRVREGPCEEELFFRGEEHTLKKRKQVTDTEKWQKKLQENWENCAELNLSFQDLGDLYQVENFRRILQRLIRVEKLWLVDNSLTDLSAIRLPRCRELNVNKNYFTSFRQLPKLPQIQHLSLAENNIMTLSGISDLRHTPLESLTLKRNPCEFQESYRQHVFSSLPNLKILDGVPKLPEDYPPPDTSFFPRMCTVL